MKSDFIRRLESLLLPAKEEPAVEAEGFRVASVLIPLTSIDDQPHFVLSRRTRNVPHHKGQICFPGGTKEPEDASLLNTALRESEEEIGLKKDDVDILGRMDPATTMTKFIITPFVGVLPPSYDFRPDPFEVEEVFYAPLSEFLDLSMYRVTETIYKGMPYPVYFIDYDGRTVWGATAKIIRRFAELII